jgi:hypothetical protein
MSFSIVAAGTVDQARAQVEASIRPDNDQFDQVKAFILAQLEGAGGEPVGDYVPGVVVEATGHKGYGGDCAFVRVEIKPVYLPLVAMQEQAAA